MKKLLSRPVFAALLFLAASLPAQSPIEVDPEERGLLGGCPFAPLQLGIGWIDHAQLFDGDADCFAALGAAGLIQRSALVSLAPVNLLQKNWFLQCGALLNAVENNWSISAAPCTLAQINHGLQAGAVDLATANFGLQTALINISTAGMGFQIGALNSGGMVQIGLCNSEGDLQIGILNYHPKAWIPWMPLFNFSRGEGN